MKYIICLIVLIAAVTTGQAQHSDAIDQEKHIIILQLVNGDSVNQTALIGQVKNLLEALPNSTIEVVCHSGGIELLLKDKSKAIKEVQGLAAQRVNFVACNNTLKRRKLTKADVLNVATVVPSGMAELVLRQEKGWVYLRAAH